MNLGLDLQGGLTCCLRLRKRLLRRLEIIHPYKNLREARIGYSQIGIKEDYATVFIRDAAHWRRVMFLMSYPCPLRQIFSLGRLKSLRLRMLAMVALI